MSIRHKIPEVFGDLFTLEKSRYRVYYGGRGGGKSWSIAQALLLKAFQKPLRILCTRELQGSIQDSVHKLLSDLIQTMEMTQFFEITQTAIRGKNGSEFLFLGIKHDPNKIKSTEAIDICWCEEADKISEQSWRFLIPTIRKEDSEIWVSFNPSLKTDPTYQRFIVNPPPNAFVKKVSWRDNIYLSNVVIDELKHDKEADYEDYMHVWEGEIKLMAEGAIYKQQIEKARKEGRITTVPIESQSVYTFWDLGRNDHTAIWFMQRIGLQNRFIDYYENRLVDIDHYAMILDKKGYRYEAHYMPHDVEVQVLGMSENRKQMFEGLGVKPVVTVPRIDHINTGIAITKKAFNACWFDEIRCEKGLDALSNYQYIYDEKHGTHRQTPYHNWASNGSDAFRMFAQGFDPQQEDWGDELNYPDQGLI